MKKDDLKAEAKRLRAAIAAMFNIPVSPSQSCELIAKAKNYPSWDAACACETRSTRSAAGDEKRDYLSAADVERLLPSGDRNQARPRQAEAEAGAPELRFNLPDVLARVTPLAETGGLVLFGGHVHSGRTKSMAAVADHLHREMNGAKVAYIQNGTDPIGLARIIVIEDVRTESTVAAAIRYADRGHVVLAAVHASSAREGRERFDAISEYARLATLSPRTVVVLYQALETDGASYQISYDIEAPQAKRDAAAEPGEIEMDQVLQQRFASGRGVLQLGPSTPDALMLAMIRSALLASNGKPFTIVPGPVAP